MQTSGKLTAVSISVSTVKFILQKAVAALVQILSHTVSYIQTFPDVSAKHAPPAPLFR